jgi:hypothetical protein
MNSPGGTSEPRIGSREPQDRLVVQLELAAVDRAPQPRRELQALERVGRAGAVDVDAATQRARFVHGGVGVLAQCLRRLGVFGEDADADAGVEQELGGAERERRVHGVGDPLADRLGVVARLDRQVADEHEESLGALARDQVARPHGGPQPGGDLRQQLLAELGAKRVVDAPEVVDVRERERDRGAGGTRVGHGGAQRLGERRASRQLGRHGCGSSWHGQSPRPESARLPTNLTKSRT